MTCHPSSIPPRALIFNGDDNSDVRLVLLTLLEGEASDDDLELDAARERKPDLILLDLMMQRMDSFEIFKELKKEGNLAGIPVTILTARRAGYDSSEGAGAIDDVNKPWDDGGLESAVKSATGIE